MDQQKHNQFAALFLRDQNRVFRYILTLVQNHADAEELFQQTGLTLWQRWQDYDVDRDFTRWACGIAHNHVRNFLRSAPTRHNKARVFLSEDVLEQVADTALSSRELLDDRRRALTDCLSELPPPQRDLLDRCYAGEKKLNAIALDQGVTDNALYKTLRRLRRALYDCINQKVDSDSAEGDNR